MAKWRKSWLKNLIMVEYDSDLDGVLDRASIPSLFGVRNEVLGKFSDPKVLILTSSMKSLLNSGEVMGNITANTQTMTFTGWSSSPTLSSWLYWDLPLSATKVYAKATIRTNREYTCIEFCDASGSTESNPPDSYQLRLSDQAWAYLDLVKNVGGNETTLKSENTGISKVNYITLEAFCDINTFSTWVNGADKWLDVPIDPSAIPSIESVRLRYRPSLVDDAAYLRGDVVIVYE